MDQMHINTSVVDRDEGDALMTLSHRITTQPLMIFYAFI